jgi:rhodanese-related sulfurtransferase
MDGAVPALSVEDFAALRARAQERPYALLDVREPWEVALGTLPEALTIPMSALADRLDTLPADRPLVVLCHHGQRSGHVTAWLRRQGYDNAVNLDGGIDAWARTVDPTMATY